MHVAMLFRYSFPHGMALANRFTALAKGLIEHGESVLVVCLAPASRELAPDDLSLHGTYQGIEYVYTSAHLFRAKSRVRHRLQMIYGFMRGMWELYKRKRANKLDVIFFSWLPIWQMTVVLLFGRLFAVKVVKETNEHLFLGAETAWKKLKMLFYFRVLVRFFSGVEVISTALERQFRPQIGKKAKLVVVPAIVDVSRFEVDSKTESPPVEGPYVAWSGSLWGKKDGAHQLIDAFSRVAAMHPKVSLVLIAPKDESPEYKQAQALIREGGCAERIVMTGRISLEEVPRYLQPATVLALARPSSVQAEYGFPTKLPEYLATGRPVLVTRTGDIPLYLQDGVNAYLVEPDDVDAFAKKLDYILGHPEEADMVGQRGKALTMRDFSNVFQAGRVASFFRQLG
ncbi:MAG: glycosyltransferase family 4 protein [Actinomycetia bacterium]|nr:glycosyltransferase family 4 protein [Actinomycetes bacterium]